MKSSTVKIPKDHSYPLKPAALERALAASGIAIDVYLTRSPGKSFNAHFWPPSPEIAHERLYVQAGSVPSNKASDALIDIETKGISELVEWIAAILALDPKSPIRRERQHLKFY